MQLMVLLAAYQKWGVYKLDSTFSLINHSSAHGNIEIYVIKIVGTTLSDLCFVILLWIDYHHHGHI